MGNRTYNLGIVGAGNISKLHASVANETPGLRVAAISDIDESRAKALADVYGCDYFSDYNKMFESDQIDIVSVCTPSSLHSQVGIAAANAGKHLIIEKPLDVTLEKIDGIIQACEKNGVVLCPIVQHRFDEDVMLVKEALDSGKMKKLLFGSCNVKWWRDQNYYDQGGWRGTWKYDGGGALMNQSIHYIDLLLHLIGPIEEIHGRCATLGHERMETEDIAVATLKFKNGALGYIEGTTIAYPGIEAVLDIYTQNGSIRIKDDHIVLWECKEDTGVNFKAGNDITRTGSARPMDISSASHQRQFADMVDALNTGRKPVVDGYEARRTIEAILAFYESSRTGKNIRLGE
ncbi:MAG TPA: gfo/Idh/MocA family oxidoreductase [Clostridiales bacterium]|nr:gfo/Idh/MocA family oxidoreductase [Clostridiales bacterium]